MPDLVPQALRDAIARRPLLARLVGNIGWLIGDRLLRLGAGVLITAWVARHLGPSDFGVLSYAMASVALFSGLATLGLADVLVRDLVRRPDERQRLLASSLVLRLLGGVAALAAALAMVAVLRPGDASVLVLVLILAAGPIAQALDVIDLRYQAETEVRAIIVIRNIAFGLVAVLRVLAILGNAPLPVFAALTSLEVVIAGALMTWRARRDGRGFALSDATLAEMQRLLTECWPLLLRALAVGLYMRIDQIMIGQLLDDRAVGLYAAAARISEVWSLVPVAVMTAVVPRLVASHEASVADYERHLLQVMRLLVWLSIGFAVVISISAPLIIRLLYGPGFAEAAPVLVLHSWSAVAVTLGVAASSWFVNMRLLRFGLLQAVVGCIVSVGANALLIPRFGIAGAAVAQTGAHFASSVLMNALFAPTRPIFRIQMLSLLPPKRRVIAG